MTASASSAGVGATRIAHLGGSGTWRIDYPKDLDDQGVRLVSEATVDTPYGPTAPIRSMTVDGIEVLHVRVHGYRDGFHADPRSRLRDQAALFWSLRELGVREILVDATVGSLNPLLHPGDIVVPHDYVDLRTTRGNFAVEMLAEGEGLRMDQPFDPRLRAILARCASERFARVFPNGISFCTEGPRLETAAEVKLYQAWGGDIVGQSVGAEIEFARAIRARYAVCNLVSNYGEGLVPWPTGATEEIWRQSGTAMGQTMITAIRELLKGTHEHTASEPRREHPSGSPTT